MSASGITSLFTEGSERGAQPLSFAASFVVHVVAISVVCFALAYKPPAKVVTERYTVRNLELYYPDLPPLPPNPHIPHPRLAAAPKPAPKPQTAQAKPGPQNLVQPDVPKPIQLTQEIPLPQIVIWSPAKVQVKNITPPQPQKPASAEVKPSLVSPNQELKLADINIASSFHPSPKDIVQASSTSPVTVHAQLQTQSPPATASQSSLQPTPVQILSLSDLRAQDQSVALPPVSETKPSNTGGAFGQGNENSTGQGSNAVAGNGAAGNEPSANPGSGSESGSGGNGKPTTTLVTVPKDGRFGSVIVGNSLQDRYPEIADVWSGRLTYTAYVHVGLAKAWILQFSLPRAADPPQAGTVVRLDAPWPYNIVRPNFDPGSVDADALMVHGFVNQAGRFETLSILFPESFPHAQFLLAALQQWQFRPAAQNGQPARVEVLLIIPEEYE